MDEKTKKQKIKNKLYLQFLHEGLITTCEEQDILKALQRVHEVNKGKHVREARSLIILAYFSGARPNEYLRSKGVDVERKGKFVVVKMKASKGGLPRPIFLPYKNKLVQEFYEYAKSLYPEMPMFYNFTSRYTRKKVTKKGKVKFYTEITDSLRYWFKKWFVDFEGSIPPYFLRHNRMSKLAENDVSMEALRMFKGSKTFESIVPYLHMSSKSGKMIGNKLD